MLAEEGRSLAEEGGMLGMVGVLLYSLHTQQVAVDSVLPTLTVVAVPTLLHTCVLIHLQFSFHSSSSKWITESIASISPGNTLLSFYRVNCGFLQFFESHKCYTIILSNCAYLNRYIERNTRGIRKRK